MILFTIMFTADPEKQSLSPAATEQVYHLASAGGWGLCAAAGIVLLRSLKTETAERPIRVIEPVPMVPTTGPAEEAIERPGVAMSIEVYRFGLHEAARVRRTVGGQ